MTRGLIAAILTLLVSAGSASAHTPDWFSRFLEWAFGWKASVGEAPSAGWMEPRPGPDFRLSDLDGRPVSLRDLRGKVVLMNFVSAGCGESCASMKELRLLATALGRKMGSDVAFVSVVLTSERDTAEASKAFRSPGRRTVTGWRIATGPPETVAKLAEACGVYVAGAASRDIEYSDVVLFFDQEGRLRKRILPHLLQLSGLPDVEWLLAKHEH